MLNVGVRPSPPSPRPLAHHGEPAHTGTVADWTTGGTSTAEQSAHLTRPFDPRTCTTVLTGEDEDNGVSWELRDGPHTGPGHDDAESRELSTRVQRGNARAGTVGPRPEAGAHLEVSGSRAGGGGAGIAMLTVRCP